MKPFNEHVQELDIADDLGNQASLWKSGMILDSGEKESHPSFYVYTGECYLQYDGTFGDAETDCVCKFPHLEAANVAIERTRKRQTSQEKKHVS